MLGQVCRVLIRRLHNLDTRLRAIPDEVVAADGVQIAGEEVREGEGGREEVTEAVSPAVDGAAECSRRPESVEMGLQGCPVIGAVEDADGVGAELSGAEDVQRQPTSHSS